MYGFSTRVHCDFATAIARTTEELKAEGFGVLSDIDIAATFKAKLGVDRLPYRILGACNPPFARQAVDAEPDVGLLMPCNVVVRQEPDGSVVVSFLDPIVLFGLVGRPEVEPLANEVKARLLRVRDRLAA